eukprot:1151688-Pelagomonas_calceolata.AAC.6
MIVCRPAHMLAQACLGLPAAFGQFTLQSNGLCAIVLQLFAMPQLTNCLPELTVGKERPNSMGCCPSGTASGCISSCAEKWAACS